MAGSPLMVGRHADRLFDKADALREELEYMPVGDEYSKKHRKMSRMYDVAGAIAMALHACMNSRFTVLGPLV